MSVSSVLLVTALAATAGQETPVPQQASTEEASLSFVSNDQALGALYGIDAIDATRSILEQRTAAKVQAGRRTIWYTCPNASQMTGGSRLTFDFEAGRDYELVCEAGKEAVIRPAEAC